jgi:hypothetical protein
VVHSVGSMLASGLVGIGALSGSLVVIAPISHPGDRRRRRVGVDNSGRHVALQAAAQNLDTYAKEHHSTLPCRQIRLLIYNSWLQS